MNTVIPLRGLILTKKHGFTSVYFSLQYFLKLFKTIWGVINQNNVNNTTVDHLAKCGFFMISSMVLGLLDQLQIF